MQIRYALQLKLKDRVFIDYSENDEYIYCAGIVETIDPKIRKTDRSVQYLMVTVRYGIKSKILPSYCLVKL